MEKQKEPKKKDFLGMMVIFLVLVIILLVLIIVNPNGIANSSSSDLDGEDMISYMMENNIIIYGSTQCPYCKAQLKEFEPYQEKAIDEGVYVFCDLVQDIECIGVTSVPAWKMNGKIVYVGYLPLDEIKNEIQYN